MRRRTVHLTRAIGWLLLSVLLITVQGCGGGPSWEAIDEANRGGNDFVLGPEDVLEISVWRNQDLSRKEVVVRPDGKISMPLIGELVASGLDANQLANLISERLKEFKERPSVSVSVKEVNSYSIYVLGEVVKPGKYQLKSHATVLQAVAVAGGFSIYAAKNKMQVLRRLGKEDGKLKEIRIPARYDDLVSGEGEIGNFILKTGDVVLVP
ncbi:MAG: polysaccharide biosynthesis/export family protein [Nitrospirae bacterium]|nr:polysaccharide biosynthesis/export family protein [Nitrospirota bacterium]